VQKIPIVRDMCPEILNFQINYSNFMIFWNFKPDFYHFLSEKCICSTQFSKIFTVPRFLWHIDFFAHQKINGKNTFLALTNSKIIFFFQNFKNRWWFELLSKICRTTFFKNTSRCIRKCKKCIFCDVTKVEKFD
jgi:hypothetical protein